METLPGREQTIVCNALTWTFRDVVNMASPPRPQQQYAKPPPCWPHLDDILRNRLAWLHFIDKDINVTKSLVRRMLDDASNVCMTASQRIFMAKDCREWF